jgi:meiotically up-regulated gene 157 (Mug157) protein
MNLLYKMERRKFIQYTGITLAGIWSDMPTWASSSQSYPVVRPPLKDRRFSSIAIESAIQSFQRRYPGSEQAWLFENCFPNTLDTTVELGSRAGKPDTYVITGDIDAMWLRDSSAQVWPYLPFMKTDRPLADLIRGVIHRQAFFILKDPYANAFYKDENKVSEWKDSDITEMKAGVHERKWEIDSLCYPIRLSYGFWQAGGDIATFDLEWRSAMLKVVETFEVQQRIKDAGPYSFQRRTAWATDGVPLAGYGYPTKKVGLIHSMFRPSDDATLFPFLIPSNYFALKSIRQLMEMIKRLPSEHVQTDQAILTIGGRLLQSLEPALKQFGQYQHPKFGKIIPYEVDGFGNAAFMDDANVPSLLSLSYLGVMDRRDPLYLSTRAFVLSAHNPFYFSGKAGAGVGGPHVGLSYIWPMSITMQALTSTQDTEIRQCLNWLKQSHANTGYMHESFHQDDVFKFTRKWFAWANTLYGELLWNLFQTKPHLIPA